MLNQTVGTNEPLRAAARFNGEWPGAALDTAETTVINVATTLTPFPGDDAFLAARRMAPVGGLIDDAFMIGRRAGEVVPDRSLKALSMRLIRNRVNLVRNADKELDALGAGGLFRVYKDGSASILLRKNATYYEVAHELRHYEHYMKIGADAYRKLSPLAREQHVYDALRRSHKWLQMTADEIKHAQDYIKRVGGDAW